MQKILIIIAMACCVTLAQAQERVRCQVVGIADGDTLTCLTADKTQIKTRLARIDAPEKRQPFGQRSRESLAGMVFEREVELEMHATDRYGRAVATVWLGKQDVNLEQIRAGLAWVYLAYPHTAEDVKAEAKAKAAGAGLWQEAGAIPPWEWRRGKHGQNASPSPR